MILKPGTLVHRLQVRRDVKPTEPHPEFQSKQVADSHCPPLFVGNPAERTVFIAIQDPDDPKRIVRVETQIANLLMVADEFQQAYGYVKKEPNK